MTRNNLISAWTYLRGRPVPVAKDEAMSMQENLEGIWNFLEGKKTYIVAATSATIVALQLAGVEVPPWVMFLLLTSGLVTARKGTSGVDKYYDELVTQMQARLDKLETTGTGTTKPK